jgi:hypothetical protein
MTQVRRVLGLIVIASLAWCQQTGSQSTTNNDLNDLTITVLEGEDGANIVKDQTFAETTVEVRDKNNLPIVEGAVTFAVVWAVAHSGGDLPGTFANGARTLTVTTDGSGRAVMTGFRPQANGPVNVQVQASYQGHTGSAVIHQTNFPTVAAARAAGKNIANQTQSSSMNSNSTAAQAASHGMSTGAKVALATLGVAAAGGGAAYGAGLFKTNTAPDCSSQANQWVQVTQTYAQACSVNPQTQQCVAQVNAYLNAANSVCSCVGGLGDLPAQYRQSLSDALNSIRQFYGASASAPACK